jgi:hypothetical protein
MVYNLVLEVNKSKTKKHCLYGDTPDYLLMEFLHVSAHMGHFLCKATVPV